MGLAVHMKMLLMTPEVSIVVPVYNAEKTLRRCIDSILAQQFSDFELILVDDGSSDGSAAICDAYEQSDARVKVVHKPNGGVSSARNAGLDIAAGRWIAFADSDDEVLPLWLSGFAENIGEADICLQGMLLVGAGNERSARTLPAASGDRIQEFVEKIIGGQLLGYSFTKLFRGDIIRLHNLRFDTAIHFREDDLFVVNYLVHGRLWVIADSAHYVYYMPTADKSYSSTATECTEPLCEALLRIYGGQPSALVINAMAWSLRGQAVESLLVGRHLSDNYIKVYRSFLAAPCTPRNIRKPLLDKIVFLSGRFPWLMSLIIRLIHRCKG